MGGSGRWGAMQVTSKTPGGLGAQACPQRETPVGVFLWLGDVLVFRSSSPHRCVPCPYISWCQPESQPGPGGCPPPSLAFQEPESASKSGKLTQLLLLPSHSPSLPLSSLSHPSPWLRSGHSEMDYWISC